MAFIPIQVLPGINKATSDYGSGKKARYSDGNHVRFVTGNCEKIGGWLAINGISAANGVNGIPRAAKAWRDVNGMPWLMIATETDLFGWDGTTLTDITPQRTISSGTLGNNPFTTVNSSPVVAVADTTAVVKNGDWVAFSGATAVNGITINGWYIVSAANPGTGYSITSLTAANNSGAGGGASVLFFYPRKLLGNNPFTTVSGSATVTVAETNHGSATGDFAQILGAASFNGVTLNGEFRLTVVNANSYTIQAPNVASGSGAGGGAVVNITHEITLGVLTLTNPVVYGAGIYGTGPYGYSQNTTSLGTAGWTLDRYGGLMLACPIGGTIYVYDPIAGGRAHPLLNAPNNVLAMFVTPERFVVALGNTTSSMQLSWADQNDFTVWTSQVTNTANSGRSLQGGTKFIGGVPVRSGVSLIFSDKAAFAMSYTGDNFVYATPEISDNASALSPWGVAVLGEAAYWWGQGNFWVWNGTVQALPSDDIRDYVFRNINPLYLQKCWAMPIRAKQEIWFSYCSAGSSEVDRYVIYHINQQCWSIGTWSGLLGSGVRTAGTDQDLYATPIMLDVNGTGYQHESGVDDNGQPLDANVTFAPIDISNGDTNVDVFGFLPDFGRLSQSISLTINTRLYPQDPNDISGPFILTANDTNPYQDIRADGKMVGFELDSNVLGGDFAMGIHRLNIQQGGARI